jgi:hypothetical protein
MTRECSGRKNNNKKELRIVKERESQEHRVVRGKGGKNVKVHALLHRPRRVDARVSAIVAGTAACSASGAVLPLYSGIYVHS